MIKRVLALLLAVVLVVAAFGCGRSEKNEKKDLLPEGTKIAIFVEDMQYDAETYFAAAEYAKAYGDSVIVSGLGEGYLEKSDVISETALGIAADPEVKAMIFAAGVEGVCRAARMVREKYEDMLIISCHPSEGNELLSHYADMTLDVDFKELAKSMVQNAKDAGAKTFVFYTTNPLLKYTYIRDFRTDVQNVAKASKITFKPALSVDVNEEGRDEAMAKQFIPEDLARKAEKYGDGVAVFCTDPLVQGVLATESAKRGMHMMSTFMPSPLTLATSLNISLEGHETDCAYAMEQLKTSAAKGGAYTWADSAVIMMLKTAFAYATGVLVDGVDEKVDVDTLTELTKDFAGSIKLSPVYDGIFLLQSELVAL